MTRLVAMPIALFAEHGIEFSDEFVTPSHTFHQTVRVVRHVPSVMTRGSFGDEGSKTERIIVRKETAVGPTPLCITGTRIDDVAIIAGTSQQTVCIGCLAQSCSDLRQSKVVVSILQRTRYLFPCMERIGNRIFKRNVSVLQIGLQSPAPHTVTVFAYIGG